jgi:NhaP-type Na+/H+ or K+/H+ antiporter
VLLLALGMLLGPDGANVIRPAALGGGLPIIVGLAVAVIRFEGGMCLQLGALQEQARPIRRLITIGALVTAVGGTLAAMVFMGWDLRLCILFGTLVIVTGSTVITPLLRRIRVQERVSTILEAEGIFIDAVGATVAVVTLEIVVAPSRAALGILGIATRLGTGAAVGIAVGAVLAVALRARRLIPSGLENILTLAFAVLAFALSNALVHESGITAAIVAGLVLGNARSRAVDHIAEFKEQLTVLWIATLFVLLAADVRLSEVHALGWPGIGTVLALMFVVRPAAVWLSLRGTDVSVNEKLFLSWLAPRGIVAAAVASLFAIELGAVDIAGGEPLRALVFLVIAVTVTVQGLSGGLVARALGVKRPSHSGVLLLGANRIALAIAELLQNGGERVTMIDANPEVSEAAR